MTDGWLLEILVGLFGVLMLIGVFAKCRHPRAK